MIVTAFDISTKKSAKVDLPDVNPRDEKWFIQNDTQVLVQDGSNDFILHALVGYSDESSAIEVKFHVRGHTCEKAFSILRNECEKAINEVRKDTANV